MKSSFGICLYEPKLESNLGVLVRSAYCFGASFICTIGHRYKRHAGDTVNAKENVPVFHYDLFSDFVRLRPKDYVVTAVETWGTTDIRDYTHCRKEIYVFGGEDRTLPEEVKKFCFIVMNINLGFTPKSFLGMAFLKILRVM